MATDGDLLFTMNQAFSPEAERIEPALETPFRLGSFDVIPAALELHFAGNSVKLEMRVMQVLIALRQRLGQPVTRDDLSWLCWDGRVVGEDALNRSISRLRKALSSDPSIILETIPKVGYRLRLEPAPELDAANALPEREAPPCFTRTAALGLSALLLAAIVLVGYALQEGKWVAEEMRPLTREAGVELFPALSPDGRQLAYSGGAGFGAPKDIYLRGLSVGDTTPLRLTSTPLNESAPAWSPDGQRLAFNRNTRGGQCTIVVMNPPRGIERTVATCKTDEFTRLAWLNGNEIVYSDRAGAGAPRRLVAVHVQTGRLRFLSAPQSGQVGDSSPVLAPDGTQLAFRRTASLGSDDTYVLDLASGETRRLAGGGWKVLGLAWSKDSETVFLTTNREGDYGLWSVSAVDPGEPQRISLGLVAFGALSSDARDNLSVETFRTRTNLMVFSGVGAPRPLTTSASNDWDPDVTRAGAVVFGSDASGTNEIWTIRSGLPPARLTNLRGSYVHSPRWSPEGRQVGFLGVRDGKTDVYTINWDGSRLRRVTNDGADKGSVAWLGRGLLYTGRHGSKWQVMRVALDNAQVTRVPGGDGLIALRRAPEGDLYARGQGEAVHRITATPDGGLLAAPSGVSVPGLDAWAASSTGVYWLRSSGPGEAAVWFTGWDGVSHRVADLAVPHKPGLTVTSAGRVVAPVLMEDAADLVLLRMEQR